MCTSAKKFYFSFLPQSALLQSLIQCAMKAKKTLKARAADIIDDVDEEEEDDDTLEEVLERVTKMMNSLKKRLLDSEMEDFQLVRPAAILLLITHTCISFVSCDWLTF